MNSMIQIDIPKKLMPTFMKAFDKIESFYYKKEESIDQDKTRVSFISYSEDTEQELFDLGLEIAS